MTDQHATHLSPASPSDDADANNGVDSFPRLVETPATMSPVPTNERNQPPPPPPLNAHELHARAAAGGGAGNHNEGQGQGQGGEDEDSSWSTDSDTDDEFSSLRAMASSGGTDPIDSRSIYQALFGGGGGMGAGMGGPPQRSSGAQASRSLPQLPVYKLALNEADIDSCVKLEEACFPGNGASRDEIAYRISKASGLNIGLFTTAYAQSESSKLSTYATSTSTETTSNRRTVLVAYINATLTTNDRILKEDGTLPSDWQAPLPKADEKLGHKPFGRTVAVHSFGVLPELRNQNIGTCLWKTFLQLVKGSKQYTRVAIAVPTDQVSWFKKHKLRTLGSSALNGSAEKTKVDMVIDYHEDDDSDDEDEGEEGNEEHEEFLDGDGRIVEEEDDGSEAAEEQLIQES